MWGSHVWAIAGDRTTLEETCLLPSRSKAEEVSWHLQLASGLDCPVAQPISHQIHPHFALPFAPSSRCPLFLYCVLLYFWLCFWSEAVLPMWTALCQVCLSTSPHFPSRQVLHYPTPQLPSCQDVRHLLLVYHYKAQFLQHSSCIISETVNLKFRTVPSCNGCFLRSPWGLRKDYGWSVAILCDNCVRQNRSSCQQCDGEPPVHLGVSLRG